MTGIHQRTGDSQQQRAQGELGMAAPRQQDPRTSYVFPSRHGGDMSSSDRKSLHTLLDTVKLVNFQ